MQFYLWMVLYGEMDSMSEERVTKEIIKYLKKNDWLILSYDFPQSGTGTLILPDNSSSEKNKDSIIPDIIAIKDNKCIFFEDVTNSAYTSDCPRIKFDKPVVDKGGESNGQLPLN